MKTAILLFSGGIDSTTCLYWAKKQGYQLICLSIDNGHRPLGEKRAANNISRSVGADLIKIDLPFLRDYDGMKHEDLPIVGKIEDGGYIPARNLIYYSIALHFAEIFGAEVIIGGHIAHDSVIFPDATDQFFAKFQVAIDQSLVSMSPKIVLPLAKKSKSEVLTLARELGVPIEETWSCYLNGEEQCGNCLSCRERIEAISHLS